MAALKAQGGGSGSSPGELRVEGLREDRRGEQGKESLCYPATCNPPAPGNPRFPTSITLPGPPSPVLHCTALQGFLPPDPLLLAIPSPPDSTALPPASPALSHPAPCSPSPALAHPAPCPPSSATCSAARWSRPCARWSPPAPKPVCACPPPTPSSCSACSCRRCCMAFAQACPLRWG